MTLDVTRSERRSGSLLLRLRLGHMHVLEGVSNLVDVRSLEGRLRVGLGLRRGRSRSRRSWSWFLRGGLGSPKLSVVLKGGKKEKVEIEVSSRSLFALLSPLHVLAAALEARLERVSKAAWTYSPLKRRTSVERSARAGGGNRRRNELS